MRVTTFRWTCDYDRETYAIRQLTSPEQRTALSPPTTNSFPHFSAIDSFDLPPTKPTHDLPFDRPSWSFTSNHLPIQWHPLPLLRRRRAAISKMRNHAMPARNGTSTYPSACTSKALAQPCDRHHHRIHSGARLETPASVLTILTSRARRPNGATQTFRRTSNAVNTSTAAPQNIENLPNPAVSSQPPRYVPPHRNGTVSDPRYSKNQLLDLYRQQQSADDSLQEDLQNLYIGGWQPNGQNGAPAAGWGRNDASREQPPGPDVCWDDDGTYEPLALTEMDDEEREVGIYRWNTYSKTPSTRLTL